MAKIIHNHGKYKSVLINTTNIGKIKDKLKRTKEEVIERLVYTLSYIGEQCVKIAREDHANNWTDITGNLRSSIAYAVLVNGKQVNDNLKDQFQQHKGKNGDGLQGLAQAKALLKSLQGEYNTGVALIVVAGMKYAAYVEGVRGKVVLAESQLKMEQLARQLLSSLVDF